MNVLEKIRSGITYVDGGAGTLLQSWGLEAGVSPETWNISNPDKIREMHRLYLEAGANIITACTFGANRLKFDNLEEIITAAIANAKSACAGYKDAYVALDIGPTGKMLEPLGDLPFEEAVSVFAETVRIGAAAGTKCTSASSSKQPIARAPETAGRTNKDSRCEMATFFTSTAL